MALIFSKTVSFRGRGIGLDLNWASKTSLPRFYLKKGTRYIAWSFGLIAGMV